MSYILDALRKSSEERRRVTHEQERPYDIAPFYETDSSKPARRAKTRGVRLGLLLVLIAVAAGLGYHYRSLVTPDPPAAAPADTPAPPQPPDAAPPIRNHFDANRQAGTPSGPQEASPPDSPEAPSLSPARQTAPAAEPAAQASIEAIPLLEDLPLTIRTAVPEMKFNGHVYSPTPRLRLIMINSVVRREGDMINPDVRLQTITETGIILSYRGTPFRMELL